MKNEIGALVLFWTERKEGGERILADIMGTCSSISCGGKLHTVVMVGRIQGGWYQIKNPEFLWQDEEFPLNKSVLCTNCGREVRLPKETAQALIASAEEWIRCIKAARKAAKARWN
ncbi:MAG: hypothetical protein Q8P39_03975 [Candidatus Yanofskybacteria bacterium]|nr:hypothetical protein [Candidatus Yanofskybacteria bacterium]